MFSNNIFIYFYLEKQTPQIIFYMAVSRYIYYLEPTYCYWFEHHLSYLVVTVILKGNYFKEMT